MRSLKALHKLFAGVALLAIIMSFSGVPGTAINFTKTQTELVIDTSGIDAASMVYSGKVLQSTPGKNITRHTVFNFKCFLIGYEFDLRVTFKTQKEAVIRFKDLNSIPQQNLIARVHSLFPHDVL